MTIIELKQCVVCTIHRLEKLRNAEGDVEQDWMEDLSWTDQGELCWPGKDGHPLRLRRSKRNITTRVQLEQEVEAFEASKQSYLTGIIDNIRMRFLNLSNELQDFLVLHRADQKDTEERLRSLMHHVNKPGLTFEFLLKQWKI